MADFVTVEIPQGKLRGKRVTSPTTGLNYYSFQGIPYAKPPLGALRFKPPEEPESWTGTRDATVQGSVSSQSDFPTGRLLGAEDCLFLNVYMPQWQPKSAKAVMVWIHGGGLSFGSGNTDVYGPDFLVAEDVILVTINYRLGLLGFLYLEGADMTANNGLRDQLMALKWVKNNIEHFGGDPNNVTIFGESAGSFSVHFLTLTPSAAGLFQRAIMQSSTAMLPGCVVSRDVHRNMALHLASLLGCPSQHPQEVVRFLRTIPAEQIIANQEEATSQQVTKLNVKTPPFLPCEESGPDALLPESPVKLLEEGRFTKVPIMAGITSGEGKVLLMGSSPKDRLAEIERNFQAVIPLDLEPVPYTDRTKKITEAIRTFYFGDQPIDEDSTLKYFDMQTDFFFLYPLYRTVQLHLRWSPHPIYVYLFDYKSSDVISSFPIFEDDFPGATHAAELPYLFQSSEKPNKFPPGSLDKKVQSTMVKLWTQFAKTGNPSSEDKTFSWPPIDSENFYCLKIGDEFLVEANIYHKRIEFLSNLYNNFKPQ